MKWIKLFEGFREDELAVEEELYRSATARYKKAVKDIEAKYKDRFTNASEQDLNTIDICVEPLVDDFSFNLLDDNDSTLYRKGMRHYAIIKNSSGYDEYKSATFTKGLYNALIKANRRIQSELPNREIYLRFAIKEGGYMVWLTQMKKLKIPKHQCLEGKDSIDNGATHFVSLDYVAEMLKGFIGKRAEIAIIA